MFDMQSDIQRWLDAQTPIALATVIETWGSSPRSVGSRMAITDDLRIAGSVSGGCVESAVAREALAVLRHHCPRLLCFGVSDDAAWEVGLACGGTIKVWVEPLDVQWWTMHHNAVERGQCVATATFLTGEAAGKRVMLTTAGDRFASETLPDGQQQRLAEIATAGLTDLKTGCTQLENGAEIFLEVVPPAPRLILIGGNHIAVALQHFARMLGFHTILIDPRSAFATSERFPLVDQILHTYPDQALVEVGLTSETYLAVLSHDPKIDDPALQVGLSHDLPYIGVLSSRRAYQNRVERLQQAGVDPERLARIHTPIGLDIQAKTPEEIALAIMAEIVRVRNGRVAL